MPATITDKTTGEILEGNNHFFQFYKHNFKMIRKLTREYPIACDLFLFLVENMDSKNALIVSQQALVEVLGVSRTSIYTATLHLVENKYIQVLKSGPANIYCVNADIVWTQRADKKKFAKFEAAVYLTSTEQEEQEPTITVKTEFQKVATARKKGKDIGKHTSTADAIKINKKLKKEAS